MRGKKNWNRLHIKTLPDGQWVDRCNTLLHAPFQVLVDFVEGEKPFTHIDWTWNRDHRKARREIAKLYCWWVRIRPARVEANYEYDVFPPICAQDEPIDDPDGKIAAAWDRYCEESFKQEDEWAKEDQKMLHRLIQIRKYLWT